MYYPDDWDPDNIIDSLADEKQILELSDVEAAEKILKENVGRAAHAIVHIAVRSPDPKLRFDAAKYVVERVMGRTTESGLMKQDDMYSDLLNDITVSAYGE